MSAAPRSGFAVRLCGMLSTVLAQVRRFAGAFTVAPSEDKRESVVE